MNLRVLPGIVWALDEPAYNYVKNWLVTLPPNASGVFAAASSWNEFIEIIDHYRKQEFDETLLQAGLSLEPQLQGRRVNVVVVGSLPAEGRTAWAEAEEKLHSLSGVISLEHYRVLLHPTLPPIGAASVQRDVVFSGLDTLRVLPWLLTRVVSGGFTLGEGEFSHHFSQLLDVLLLAERDGGRAPGYLVHSFFQSQPQPRHVRLAGFPRLSLGHLLTEMAAFLAQAMLQRAYQRPYEETRPAIQALEKQLAGLVGEFLRGERTATQVEDHFFRLRAFPNLSTSAILREVPEILHRQTLRLRQDAIMIAPPDSWWTRLWRRILAFFGRNQPADRDLPDRVQRDYLVKRFTRTIEVIKEVTSEVQAEPNTVSLPDDFIKDWADEINVFVRRGLQEGWGRSELKNHLKIKMERYLQENFFHALLHWDLKDERVREVARALDEGNLLRFSAPLIGGLTVSPQAVVTSLNLGEQIPYQTHKVPCATLSFYPGWRPLLVGASEAVPLEHISL